MKQAMRWFGALSLWLGAQNVLAGQEIQVWARTYHWSCQYYSSTDGDFAVTFKDTDVPYGSSVTLVSGFGTNPMKSSAPQTHWQNRVETKMEAVNVSTWRIQRSAQLYSRSSSVRPSRLEFAFRVNESNGKEWWVTPSRDGSYFYAVSLGENSPCMSSKNDFPEFKRLDVKNFTP